MVIFIFTKAAKKIFFKLPRPVQERISEKLKGLKKHPDIFSVLKRLHDFAPATHRLRIGSFRLIVELKIFEKNNIEFWILDIGDRKDIYR